MSDQKDPAPAFCLKVFAALVIGITFLVCLVAGDLSQNIVLGVAGSLFLIAMVRDWRKSPPTSLLNAAGIFLLIFIPLINARVGWVSNDLVCWPAVVVGTILLVRSYKNDHRNASP